MLRFKILCSLILLVCVCNSAYSRRTTPVMGWSSWNTYRINISDSLIRRQADELIATGLKDAGYEYINIDDGFFGYRDSTGLMHSHPQRFPHGMKVMADYIHSLGLKAGLYSDAGAVTCGSIWDDDPNGIGAGLYGHENQDAELYFSDWGFDFIKIDYCGAGQELDLDEKERYTAIRRAIDNCGADDIDINICRWAFPGTWAADLAASWRISGDISDSWTSVKHIIEKNLPLSAYCRNARFNDMDMLEIGRSLTESEERVHFGLWCMMASPLLIGCDLTDIRPNSLELLKNKDLIALNQDSLGLQAYPVRNYDDTWVLVKDLETLGGLVRAVALYNPTDTARRISVSFRDLDLDGLIELKNLFNGEKTVITDDSLIQNVPPHDVIIYRAEASRRLEPNRYEAEWAYLPMFNDLGKWKKEIRYIRKKDASSGFVVANAGGRKANSIIWDHVFSAEGGTYHMTIFYTPAKNRGIEITVNGIPQPVSYNLKTTGPDTTLTVPVMLSKGNNIVELTCSTMWMPDIDKIEISPRK